MTLFSELALLLAVVTVISLIMRFLRQPLMIGYILSGILLGPVGFNLIQSTDVMEMLSKIGIAVLLFIVGLHLSPQVIKELGKVSLLLGIGQVVITSLIGFALGVLIGLPTVAALYVAIAFTLSSTIIVLKLLADKGHVQALYGKLAVGVLIVQDVVASIVLLVISGFSHSDGQIAEAIGKLILTASLILLVLLVLQKYVLPKLIDFVSAQQELLFVFTLSWGLAIPVIFQQLGLSIEIGALVAGVVLSTLPTAEEMSAKLRPIRDFFVVLFFVVLGTQLDFSQLNNLLLPAAVFSAFVLIGNPVVVIVIMNWLGFHRKTSFLTGLTMTQVSEFSLILATLGFQLGHVSQSVLTLITLVGLFTIAISTYLIQSAEWLFLMVERWLSWLELRPNSADVNPKQARYTIMLFGCNRTGHLFIKLAQKRHWSLAVVDYDPQAQEKFAASHTPVLFGDAQNSEFLRELPLSSTRLAVSSISDLETNLLLNRVLKQVQPQLSLIAFANSEEESAQLYGAGLDYVILPHETAAKSLVRHIEQFGLSRQNWERSQQRQRS